MFYKTRLLLRNGLKTDGVNDYIQFSASQILSPKFTVCLRVDMSLLTADRCLFSCANTGTVGVNFMIYYRNSRIEMVTRDGSGGEQNLAIGSKISGMNFMSYSYNAGVVPIANVNGNAITGTNAYANGFVTPSNYWLGYGPWFSGSLVAQATFYDLKVFNTNLSAAQLLDISRYNVIPDAVKTNLVLNCPFSNRSGNVVNGFDAAGGAFNGSLINYVAADYALGSGNKWVDLSGNSFYV